MVTTVDRPHMYFDVDSTLIKPYEGTPEIFSQDTILINNSFFKINTKVIQDIKLCKTRGHTCVVWSQGGSSWAQTVLRTLDLERYVDICMAKPSWFVDDRSPYDILDASRWYDGNF